MKMKATTSMEAWRAISEQFLDRNQVYDQQQIEEMAITTMHIEKKISKLSPINLERCIFRVPDALRLGNSKFYEPKVLSIGPYHRGKPRLASMEEHKIRYLQELLQEKKEQSVQSYVQAIKPHEERVRKCYGESIDNVSSVDLIQMLVLDGCFIIELIRRMENRRDQYYSWLWEKQKLQEDLFNIIVNVDFISSNKFNHDDPVINSDLLLNALQNDLLLAENQIPFFIIQILYGVICGVTKDNKITELNITKFKTRIIKFLCRKYLLYELLPHQVVISLSLFDKCHLLDIAHKTICPSTKEEEVVGNSDKKITLPSFNTETFCFVDSATKLEEANVKLKAVKNMIGISNIFDIKFSQGELRIPSFAIDYHLEVDIRNFIALELCQQDRKNRYFCDYVVFMDHLITSTEDVQLLIHRGIITNQMIDANFVDSMFKRLTKNIVTSDPYTYYQISKELNEYCDRPRNKWSASFKQKYFKSPWTFISILAASMLLALTITQTWYTIISYYK